jgi:Zn-finger nucleic acid-binding protein
MTAPAQAALACGNCRQPMQRLALADHYQRRVDLDLCADCHLVWFDLSESARLGGPALLELIDQMAAAQRLPHVPLRDDAVCPRCQGSLKTVHNRTRWGESLQLECRQRHGAFQSFAQYMQEKGLLRPMSHLDRVRLLERDGHVACVNCGAAISAGDESCPYCRSVPSLLDVARLAHALDPQGTLAPQPVQSATPQQQAMRCAACGAALPPGQTIACTQCGATLAISRLAEAVERVDALGPALRAQALAPDPEVVKRRLAELDADLPRQRERVESMKASVHGAWAGDDDRSAWRALFSGRTNPWRAVLLALAIWFAWSLWPF